MAKLQVSLNTEAIVNRVIDAAGMKNVAELAKALNLSSQSLSQAKERKMISLPFILVSQELTNRSLDYLVHGAEYSQQEEGSAEDEKKYLEIDRIGGGTVKILAELLRQGVDAQSLKAYVQEHNLFVIDTADKVVTNGTFAFGDRTRPAIRKCCLQIDGLVVVEGEEKQQSTEDLDRCGILGRVILHQVAP